MVAIQGNRDLGASLKVVNWVLDATCYGVTAIGGCRGSLMHRNVYHEDN